jgi:3-deoxy-D-manno-octulosonate 8-phosphate phosphatase (KDO 8-P phosphatase)
MDKDTTGSINYFKGEFLEASFTVAEKLARIKVFVFDWDGVFNNGVKDENGSSAFSEIDAMGTNLLRFNHYLRTGKIPYTVIISGESNKASQVLAKREHFNAVYYKTANKILSFNHLCKHYQIEPAETAFIFDDVLDFSMAKHCGIRIMVSRTCNPLLIEFAKKNRLADYITDADGGNHAVRESAELLISLSGKYEETIEQRMLFSAGYAQYLKIRNEVQPVFYTSIDSEIIEQKFI